MLDNVKDFVAFGEIDEQTIIKLVKARGRKVDKTEISDAEAGSMSEDLLSGKKMEEIGLRKISGYARPR